MLIRKIMGGLAVLGISFLFAAAPAQAAPNDKRTDPPQTKEQNLDYVVGEEMC